MKQTKTTTLKSNKIAPKSSPLLAKLPAPMNNGNKQMVKMAKTPVSMIHGGQKIHNEEKEVRQAEHGIAKHVVNPSSKKKHGDSHWEKIQKELTPWIRCMLSPFEYRAAQIPDANTFPSACFNIYFRGSFTVAVNTVDTSLGNSFAICVGTVYDSIYGYRGGNIVPSVDLDDLTTAKYFGCIVRGINNTTASSGIVYLPTNATQVLVLSSDDYAAFSPYLKLIRPVSASVKATCIGPSLTRSRMLYGSSYGRMGCLIDGFKTGCNFANLANGPNSIAVPATDTTGGATCVQVNYSPTDNVNYEYLDPRQTFDGTRDLMWQNNRGELWIMGTGLQTGEIIQYEVALGFEFQPSTGILDIVDATPSFTHPEEEARGENMCAVVPKAITSDMEDSRRQMETPGMDDSETFEKEKQKVKSGKMEISSKSIPDFNDTSSNAVRSFKRIAKETTSGKFVSESSQRSYGNFVDGVHNGYKKTKNLLKEIVGDLGGFTKFLL